MNPTARVLAVIGPAIAIFAGCELAEFDGDELAVSEGEDIAVDEPIGSTTAALTAGSVTSSVISSGAERSVAKSSLAKSSGGLLAAEAAPGLELVLDPDPPSTTLGDCVCISFPDPGSCAAEQFFCNVERSCLCDTGGRLSTLAAPITEVNVLSAGRAAPDSSTEPAASAQLAARTTTTDPPPPVPEIGCICGPGSVSAPASDCNPTSWYCNASAVCRCRR